MNMSVRRDVGKHQVLPLRICSAYSNSGIYDIYANIICNINDSVIFKIYATVI